MDWCIEGDATIAQRLELIDRQRDEVLSQLAKLNETLHKTGIRKGGFELIEKLFRYQAGRLLTHFILRTVAFIRFNLEYIIGITLLLLATKWSADYLETPLSDAVIVFGGILGGIALLIINRAGTQIELIRLRENRQEQL